MPTTHDQARTVARYLSDGGKATDWAVAQIEAWPAGIVARLYRQAVAAIAVRRRAVRQLRMNERYEI